MNRFLSKQANATYEDMLRAQQQVVEANRSYLSRQEALDEQEGVANQAANAYRGQPNANGLRATVGLGLIGAGATGGALLGARSGTKMPGAFLGGAIGMLGNAVAQPMISNSLDKRHPERVEARGAMNAEYNKYNEMEERTDAEEDIRDMAMREAVQMGYRNPSLYSQATREVGDDYPLVEAQNMMGKLRMNDQQKEKREMEMQRMEMEERKLSLQGMGGQNQLTAEELKKQQLKNQKRESEMTTKEAFVYLRHSMEKRAASYQEEDPKRDLAWLGGAGAAVGGLGAYEGAKMINHVPTAAQRAYGDMNLHPDVLDTIVKGEQRTLGRELLTHPGVIGKHLLQNKPLHGLGAMIGGGTAGAIGYELLKNQE
jgi:hypothetical protein